MKDTKSRVILLVEDEAIIAMTGRKMLERNGYSVITVHTGEKAVETALADPAVDLILMDINLGKGIDGTRAAELILKERDIPLVFLSSHTEPEVVEKTEGITSYGYIVKNSGETVLLASIKMAFRLWESEERFRAAFEKVAVGMVMTSPEGELLRVNEAFASMLGYSVPEIQSANFAELTHPDDVAMSVGYMRSMLGDNTGRCRFEKRYLHKSGAVVWTDISVVLLRDSLGAPIQFVSHIQDISEERRIKEELERQRRQYDLLLRSAPVSILVLQHGKYVFCNPFGARLLGYDDPAEVIGLAALNTIAEESRELARSRIGVIDAGGENDAEEMVLLRRDGSTICSESLSIPIEYDGDPAALIIGRDLTEQKKTEERLRAAESIAHIGHYDIDLASGTAVWSEETFLIFGLDPAGPAPDIDAYAGLLHEEDRESVFAAFNASVREKKAFDLVYRIRHASGEVRHVHSIGRLRYNSDGTPAGMFGTFQDITDLKRAEESLAESRNRLISIFKAAPTGIGVVQGTDRIIREVNEKVCAITGYSREELVGQSARILYLSQADYDFVGSEKYRQIAQKGTGAVETRWKRKSGEVIDVLLASTPIYPGEVARGVSFTVMDITERKRDEEKIRALAAEKETLLKEVQHRIKNTMNTMVAMLALQADSLEEGSAAAAALKDAGGRFRSMELLYEKLYRTESHERISAKEYLSELAGRIVELYPNRNRVALSVDIEDFQLDAKCLSSLGMIVNELVTNAMKYAFDGDRRGALSITVGREGEQVRMVVQDDGPGIPENGKGAERSGFGMTMIAALTEQLEGTISFERDRGTRAVLTFGCVQ